MGLIKNLEFTLQDFLQFVFGSLDLHLQADWLLHNIIPDHVSDQLKKSAKYSENHKVMMMMMVMMVRLIGDKL